MLVRNLGEEALLEKLRELFAPAPSENVALGIGDDAALVNTPSGYQSVLTTDLLLENIHFHKEWQPPRQLGSKALAVNLSDLAAMGSQPVYCLLSLAFPENIKVDYILEICHGALDMAKQAGVAVIGGDTTASESGLIISVTAGGIIPAGKAVLRSGAQEGDAIIVSGWLGSAAAGLMLMQHSVPDSFNNLRQAFISPEPEIELAQAARAAGATSMTDLSDGLASDLRHICRESGKGAVIRRDRLPVHPELLDAAQRFGWETDSLILTGGEDYGLLFTLPGSVATETVKELKMNNGKPLSIIGEVCESSNIVVLSDGVESRMPERGFDHFLRR